VRDEYFKYCKDRGIEHNLYMTDVSYSRKLKIIGEVFEYFKGNVPKINKALRIYKLNYLNMGRVNHKRMINEIKTIGNNYE
jgi:hypothetical protein